MAKKDNLFFRNPSEGVVVYQQKTRVVKRKDDGLPKYYEGMKDNFRRCITSFNSALTNRIQNRDNAIQQPHIEYISLTFFGSFDSEKFVARYRENFGLIPILFDLFNTHAIFAIENQTKFKVFFEELEKFIAQRDHTGELNYNVDIRYIKEFKLLTNDEIISYDEYYNVAIFSLVESEEILTNTILPIEKNLTGYLASLNVPFDLNYVNRSLQVWGLSETQISYILSNFDIIHRVNSSLTGVIGPSAFNTPIRDFGFTPILPSNEHTIIGILDSGVQNIQPLAPLLKNTNAEYDLKGSGSLVDNYDRGYGHGTGVAGLAAYGSKLIPDHTGNKQADAWIVSIKIFEDGTPRSSDNQILNLIRKVNTEKAVRLFVLTVTDADSKKNNETHSAFAFSLDKLAHELDILIFITSGNISMDYFFDASNNPTHSYPLDFRHEHTNLKSPSESINNLCIGAIASNFETGNNNGIAIDGTHPPIYTSKFHYDLANGILSSQQVNKHLKKPDLIYCGGDQHHALADNDLGIKHFSARNGIFYDKAPGTSYAAPLVANMAACILNKYPKLRTQTVKALLINSAKKPELGDTFTPLGQNIINRVIGHGIPEIENAVFSEDNSVNVILEDSISPDRLKSYEIKIPEYLIEKLNKGNVLDITATLCFSVDPVLNNQMTYCPIHIAFGIFKNVALDERNVTTNDEGEEEVEYLGINGNNSKTISFRNNQGWSEDYYFKRKLLSNVQKVEWSYTKGHISENENVFKLAVNCKRHKLLSVVQMDQYNQPHKFSIVLNFKEREYKKETMGNLYDELTAINEFKLFADLEAEGTAEAEA